MQLEKQIKKHTNAEHGEVNLQMKRAWLCAQRVDQI